MKRIELTVAVLAATIFLAYLAGHRPRVSAARGQKGSEASAASSVPDFALKDLEGRDESLGQFKGKVVLVNFWATWCAPCGIEIPWLMDLQEKYAPQGFTVLGIAMDEEGKSAVVPFVQKERFKLGTTSQPMNYPILIGNEDAAEKFGGLVGLPTTVLISQDGRQVKRIDGLLNYEQMGKAIKSLLETGAR
jgi:cytochrome c biogenesis protein CcmG/thiol:disulfide interchange protein DsbE